jgi:hypothetical protein
VTDHTVTDTPPDDTVRQWCADATDVLTDAAVRAGRLAAAVATDWLDDHGRGWAGRITRLRRDLEDSADQAEELASRLQAPDSKDSELGRAMAAAVRAASAASRGGDGPRLGDTSGTRVDDEHGIRIAELPDAPGN